MQTRYNVSFDRCKTNRVVKFSSVSLLLIVFGKYLYEGLLDPEYV